MPKPKNGLSEELILAQALVYFVFIGLATVTAALAAHVQLSMR